MAYLTREEAMYRLYNHDRRSRTLLIKLYQHLPDLIPHSLEYFKIDFSELEQNRKSKISYIITSNNLMNNNLKLDLIVSERSHLIRACSILESRHSNNNGDFAHIKDTLTILG